MTLVYLFVGVSIQFRTHFLDAPKPEVYYMGLIDILTHYDTKKKAAHAMKTAKHGVSRGKRLQNFVILLSHATIQ